MPANTIAAHFLVARAALGAGSRVEDRVAGARLRTSARWRPRSPPRPRPTRPAPAAAATSRPRHLVHVVDAPKVIFMPFLITPSTTRMLGNGAAVLVVVRVEDERAQRAVGVALRGRHALHDRLEQLGDAVPSLALTERMSSGSQPIRSRLPAAPLGLGARQVDLVEDRDDLEPASSARKRFESVCAWMPCDASTTRIAPSHAASERETS
jgi:hypothetical protein